jgi:hypothetical protein
MTILYTRYVIIFCLLQFQYWSIDPLTIYRPVIEKDGPGAFLTAHPKTIWRNGDFKHVPWMTGVVVNEGVVRSGGLLYLMK